MKTMTREAAAEYLAEQVTGANAETLLAESEAVQAAFESAMSGHRTCGCERARRTLRAAEVLLGVKFLASEAVLPLGQGVLL